MHADDERKALQKKCKVQQYAFEACMFANKEKPENCKPLRTMWTECLTNKIDPQAADAFKNCVLKSYAVDRKDWSASACDGELQVMEKSLKKAGLWPLPTREKSQ